MVGCKADKQVMHGSPLSTGCASVLGVSFSGTKPLNCDKTVYFVFRID